MGNNTLVTKSDGQIISSTDVNQFQSALNGDVFPRNGSGVVTTEAGSLGSVSIEWLKAHIASGYWNIGDIKAFHSFNGTVSIGQGWFPCLGGIINSTNYDAIHGSGSWTTYVGSSALDGKYAPDLTDKYLVGAASTTQTGASAITAVGNASHQVNISHTHSGASHNHQWLNHSSGGNRASVTTGFATGTYNSGGGVISLNWDTTSTSYYTSSATGTTGSGGSATQDVQPESIEVIYYIRII